MHKERKRLDSKSSNKWKNVIIKRMVRDAYELAENFADTSAVVVIKQRMYRHKVSYKYGWLGDLLESAETSVIPIKVTKQLLKREDVFMNEKKIPESEIVTPSKMTTSSGAAQHIAKANLQVLEKLQDRMLVLGMYTTGFI